MMPGKAEAEATLQARLEGALSEMKKEKDVLRQLELSRSRIQRQLNDLHDPIARLPLEISSEIFIYCLPPHEEVYTSLCDPLPLLSICTLWTEIALSTPRLWADLSVEMPPTAEVTTEFETFLNGWLLRGRNHPLSLSFTGSPAAHPGILAIVVAQAHRLRELEVECPSYLQLFSPPFVFPRLEFVNVRPP
ncbi:hypothetical protein DFH08DRAFT_788852 [Mycena albidolilacea]|uniref:F-box domain-containing protein n=1 Tax=Mycena albidolilacea TaxID=1033008 RepID=A0AAD7EH11_9AGAR|nr:hypothetical protein DFH08DRAFT_788852 [Mycena albidolilacea]